MRKKQVLLSKEVECLIDHKRLLEKISVIASCFSSDIFLAESKFTQVNRFGNAQYNTSNSMSFIGGNVFKFALESSNEVVLIFITNNNYCVSIIPEIHMTIKGE